jgi:very-short-patch-repair endonuclease
MDSAAAKRTAWLEREGCRVIRFWNNEVLGNIEGVVESIRSALRR